MSFFVTSNPSLEKDQEPFVLWAASYPNQNRDANAFRNGHNAIPGNAAVTNEPHFGMLWLYTLGEDRIVKDRESND
jgi:hypothetical protein